MVRYVPRADTAVVPRASTDEATPDQSATARTPSKVPQIFESVRAGTVADAFWRYYNVDMRNPSVNPQESLVRFVSDLAAFVRPAGSVLSLGCGYGLNEILLSFLVPGLEIVGVDILDDKKSDEKIRSMKEIARRVASRNVTPLLGDGGRLPFQKASFDCVLAVDCLSHADYMRENLDLRESQGLLLAEMSRVVRPGGQLVAIENSAISARNVVRKSRTSCHPVNPFYLRSVVERLGFRKVRIVPYYDLTGRTDLSARLMGEVLRRWNAFGMFLAPLFLLGARRAT